MPPATAFSLLPASLEDGPELVRVQLLGFEDDAFRRASFPNVPLEISVADSIDRWPANFLAPGGIYMKTVYAETGEMIGYSKWEVGDELARELKGKWGTDVVVEGAEKLERRDPVGLNDPLAEKMSADIYACRTSVIGERPRIVLSLLCTLPAFRGTGVASQHLEWATDVADKAKLPIWLDASPMSVKLYEKYGFVAIGDVRSDLSLGSKGVASGTYVHTCMLREPREKSS